MTSEDAIEIHQVKGDETRSRDCVCGYDEEGLESRLVKAYSQWDLGGAGFWENSNTCRKGCCEGQIL